MTQPKTPIANPEIVFRDEFDDWAILFDPETGNSYGLNPVSAFVWKNLDGTRSANDIYRTLLDHCDDVPDDAQDHIESFIDDLIRKGYAGFKTN